MKKRRRIAIRRDGCAAFVPHADYLIIGSNFCQAPVANLVQEQVPIMRRKSNRVEAALPPRPFEGN
jgi:hypothetical protein